MVQILVACMCMWVWRYVLVLSGGERGEYKQELMWIEVYGTVCVCVCVCAEVYVSDSVYNEIYIHIHTRMTRRL